SISSLTNNSKRNTPYNPIANVSRLELISPLHILSCIFYLIIIIVLSLVLSTYWCNIFKAKYRCERNYPNYKNVINDDHNNDNSEIINKYLYFNNFNEKIQKKNDNTNDKNIPEKIILQPLPSLRSDLLAEFNINRGIREKNHNAMLKGEFLYTQFLKSFYE